MALKEKYQYKHEDILRDARPWTVRTLSKMRDPSYALLLFTMGITLLILMPELLYFTDLVFLMGVLYFWWLMSREVSLPFKLPKSARRKDPNFKRPDGSKAMADGILYLGNDHDSGDEIWFTNSDARTHCLYLGTTGSGKTFGLKSYACNALCWSSGFIYIDGKADTDLWSTLSAMARRFGRDDDLLIMNYMTGNVSGRVPSNTMNPFSSGSPSYLTNMLVSLMPDSEGDNAMWKERAVALVSALMPCLVWKRENQNIPLSIGVIRQYLTFKAVIKLSRDPSVPQHLTTSVKAYLAELPGFVDSAFDDTGELKAGSDGMIPDMSTANQQHGYLSMQFTRSMQSLGDDYGFIFDTQAADIDMLDVVLNRRILVVLIPALEKSADETANLGKIIASTLKGMMGATLGNSVEGEAATAIENKPTNSATPFIAIFDEVGYYTSQGMAVMAAQARSLGFSLVFAGQDLPALEKRVKEEARSITANCNIKLFGKLEDPTSTKDFFEKTVGQAIVTEVSGFARGQNGSTGYTDSQNASVQVRARASYDGLKGYTEGRAICAFGKSVNEIQVYNSDIGHAKAMRVQRFLPIPPPAEEALDNLRLVDAVLRRLRNPQWDPSALEMIPNRDIDALAKGFSEGRKGAAELVECGINGVAAVADAHGAIKLEDVAALDAPPAPMPDIPMRAGASLAEKTAAEAVARTTGGGPLSWMEVIGGATAASAPAMPAKTDAPAKKTVSWDDVARERDGDLPVAPVPAQAPASAEPAPAKGPMSWMDVIGGIAAEGMPFLQTPAAAAITLPPKAPPAQLPLDMPKAPPATEQKVAPPQPARDTEQENTVKSPMSWADVIGLTSAADKEEDKK